VTRHRALTIWCVVRRNRRNGDETIVKDRLTRTEAEDLATACRKHAPWVNRRADRIRYVVMTRILDERAAPYETVQPGALTRVK
jgi:hypothetical protein